MPSSAEATTKASTCSARSPGNTMNGIGPSWSDRFNHWPTMSKVRLSRLNNGSETCLTGPPSSIRASSHQPTSSMHTWSSVTLLILSVQRWNSVVKT
ncbi:hypothetical protein ACFFX0_32870 [Citricoccus parietis]|uniref:Uncharacterized protein n=1 Tax=Citricoccus parietis TaxID=592307 RepID=A0ABV5G9S6_9MICC